jgi:alpha-1,3/alpha-1,6-mannosyltransferase
LKSPTILVIAGGYDERVIENVEHHLELVNLSQKLNVKVIFLRSISS